MNSSSLNEHLFNRNLVESPYCSCGQVESAPHFLLSCNKYCDLRNELIFTIDYQVEINAKFLLFGSDTLNSDQNKNVFIRVQNFIIKSKRFSH